MASGGSILIDHYKNPRFKGVISEPDRQNEIVNRKCGDRLFFTARIESRILKEIRFEGQGCFYCLASASILCCSLSGKVVDNLPGDIAWFRQWLMASPDPSEATDPTESPGPSESTEAPGPEGDGKSSKIMAGMHRLSALNEEWEAIHALGEVKAYPMRIDCVDLAWKGVEEMLRK